MSYKTKSRKVYELTQVKSADVKGLYFLVTPKGRQVFAIQNTLGKNEWWLTGQPYSKKKTQNNYGKFFTLGAAREFALRVYETPETTRLAVDDLHTAIHALYASCLNGMGGENYDDLQNDPLVWVAESDLKDLGWNKSKRYEAWHTLQARGFIEHDDTALDGASWSLVIDSPEMETILRAIDNKVE